MSYNLLSYHFEESPSHFLCISIFLAHVIIFQPEGFFFFFFSTGFLLVNSSIYQQAFVYLKTLYFTSCFERYFHWVWNSKLGFFSFSNLKMLLHCFLACIVSARNLMLYLLFSPLCLFF